MAMTIKTLASVLSGLCLAVVALGPGQSYAQSPKAPRAYYISEFVVNDPEAIKPYSAQVESTFKPFSGRYVVRAGKIAALEGEAPKGRIVMIEFDSVEKAQAWYDSPEYRAIRPIRHRSASSRVFIVEGLAE